MARTSDRLRGCKVLIVEDQFYIAAEMRGMVVQRGGQVVGPVKSQVTAEQALETTSVDLAILDVNLGQDRVYTLARRLLDDHIPVVFATGYESWALEAGFSHLPLMAKPVSASAFDQALDRIATLRKDEVAP